MRIQTFTAILTMFLASVLACAGNTRAPQTAGGIADWHTHLSLESTSAPDSARAQRAALLPELQALVGRVSRGGVLIATGADVAGVPGAPSACCAIRRELELLADAGLHSSAIRWASSTAFLEE